MSKVKTRRRSSSSSFAGRVRIRDGVPLDDKRLGRGHHLVLLGREDFGLLGQVVCHRDHARQRLAVDRPSEHQVLTRREHRQELLAWKLVERWLGALAEELGQPDLPGVPFDPHVQEHALVGAEDAHPSPFVAVEEELHAKISVRGVLLEEDVRLGEGSLLRARLAALPGRGDDLQETLDEKSVLIDLNRGRRPTGLVRSGGLDQKGDPSKKQKGKHVCSSDHLNDSCSTVCLNLTVHGRHVHAPNAWPGHSDDTGHRIRSITRHLPSRCFCTSVIDW
jgi:hypothetical protein